MILAHKQRFADMSEGKIRAEMSGWKQTAPEWIAGDIVLKERERDERTKGSAKEWHEKVSGKYLIGVIIGLTVLIIGLLIRDRF